MQDKREILGFDIDYIPPLLAEAINGDDRHDHCAYSMIGYCMQRYVPGDTDRSRSQIFANCFVDFTIDVFGPFAAHVLGEWGVESADDIADMLTRILMNTEFFPMASEDIDEFRANFDFNEAFVAPFEP